MQPANSPRRPLRHPLRHPLRRLALHGLLAILLAGLFTSGPATAEEINRIILRVNDQIATLHEYEKRKAEEISRLLQDTSIAPAERQDRLAEIGQMVLFAMYREMLLESHAERSGATISEREIDASVDRMMEQRGIESREELRDALSASNMTLDDLRESVREELLFSQVVQRDVTGRIEVGEDELRAYYRNNPERFRVPEERRIEEIIVLEESGLEPDALAAKANEIRESLARELPPVESPAEEATDAAAEKATDEATDEAGDLSTEATPDAFDRLVAPWQEEGLTTAVIELGWLEKDDLGQTLGDAAWAIEAGTLTQPVQARGGFHILRVLAVRGGEILPYNEVENRILAFERQRRFGKTLNEFMGELAATSYVVEDIPPEAIGYRALADFSVPEELSLFKAPLRQDADETDGAALLETDSETGSETTTDETDPETAGSQGATGESEG